MFRSITHELRHARDIVHGGRAVARLIADRIEPRLSAVLEEVGSLPKYWLALFQLALASMTDRDSKMAVRTEKELRKERRKEKEARELRDETKGQLYRLLLGARSFLEGALKQGASAALAGLDPNLAQLEALVLLRYGAEFEEELSNPNFRPEALVVDGSVTTPQEYALKVREATDALQNAEDQLADQVRVTEQKLKLKERALEKLSKGNGCCGRILEELYVLAGEEFHAERLRSSSRRRAAAPVEDDPSVVEGHFNEDPLDDEELGLGGEETGDDQDPTPEPNDDATSDVG